MGRNSKEHIELTTKKIYKYLIERETCSKRLKAVQTITNSLLKCRSTNGERKRKYRAELDNAHRVLCSGMADGEEYRQKYLDIQTKYTQAIQKRTKVQDENVALSWKVRDMERIKYAYERHKDFRLQTEQDCGVILEEKRTALRKCARLEEELAKLKATLKSDPVSSESS